MSLSTSATCTMTYDIPQSTSLYRYLRLKLTDKCYDGTWTMSLGGVEFYGELCGYGTPGCVKKPAVVPVKAPVIIPGLKPSQFTYSGQDFDKKGIVHHLMQHSTHGSGSYPIHASRISDAQGKAADPLFNVSGTCCTSNKLSNGWWKFDFQSRKVSPTKYVVC